jgi:phosphatidylinositol alpha-mannosyltransferase
MALVSAQLAQRPGGIEPVRVALVCPYDLDRFGGVQHQVLMLAAWLRDDGYRSVVVGPGGGGDGIIGLGPATTVSANRSSTPIILDPRVAELIREVLSDVDVIHVHEPLMPMVSLAAARVARHPLVGTFHADPPRWVRHGYRAGAPLVRRMLRRFSVLTAVSPVAAGAVDSLASVRLVPNGVDVARFTPGGNQPLRVAFIGRDDPRKGLDDLLAAWPAVRARVPEAELIVAAGPRREQLEGAQFVGAVDEAAKRTLLESAGVFCAPNVSGESFGIVLVEAMAAGCAVVASALPGFTHVVGDAGMLTKPGDVAGLARSLIHALENDAHRVGLQRRGRERAWRFDRSPVLAGYLNAYEDAAGAGPGPER